MIGWLRWWWPPRGLVRVRDNRVIEALEEGRPVYVVNGRLLVEP